MPGTEDPLERLGFGGQMFRRQILALAVSAFLLPATGFAADAQPLYFNANGNAEKSLPFKVLKLALEKSGKQIALTPAPIQYSNSAAQIEAIANGAQLDIVWASASKATSGKLLSVPFPVDGGLLGWRVFLIDGARQAEFDKVKSFEDISKFVALQGAGWADVATLREAGLTVRTGPKKNLYKMTVGGRGDYFARATYEAIAEQKAEVENVPSLAIEKSLVLQYPATTVFYVSKDKPGLRDDIARGLETAFNDGSYRKLFLEDANVKAALTDGNLKTRTVIRIKNPNFPDELASIDPKYWFDPQK